MATKRTDEEIALIRAQRAEKKAKKTSLEEVKKYFPNEEATKDRLSQLQREIRQFRKKVLKIEEEWRSQKLPQEEQKRLLQEQGHLPEKLKKPFFLALDRLNYDTYRPEMEDLLIEGLKLQDRELKIASYQYLDNLFTTKGADMGWLSRMLNKRYVSRYGWALIRKHAVKGSRLALYGGYFLGELLDKWAKDEKTQKDWERLSREDGKPADMREILPRR